MADGTAAILRWEMGREFNRWLVNVLTPPFRVLGFVVGNVYSLLFGWYDKRLGRREQARLEQEVQEHLWFLPAAQCQNRAAQGN